VVEVPMANSFPRSGVIAYRLTFDLAYGALVTE
jgi:hypothetical protein